MTDVTAKLAAWIEEAVEYVNSETRSPSLEREGRALLAAYEAAQAEPVAWRTFDGEGGYEYRTYTDNEDYAADWAKRNPKHLGWVEPLFAAPVAQAEPMDMALCEATRVVLREGQLYRFRRVGDCETCAELSKQSLEAYGQPPKESQP